MVFFAFVNLITFKINVSFKYQFIISNKLNLINKHKL